MYFDYKHFPHWIPTDSELFKVVFKYKSIFRFFFTSISFEQQISWSSFGFPELTANESTLWVGSKGAHTPCHQDTYGRNIVVQVYGRYS